MFLIHVLLGCTTGHFVARIALYDHLHSKKIVVFSSSDLMGNLPVKSTYMVPSF